MSKGFDTTQNCTQLAQQIKDAGYSFVARYYNTNSPHKNLTKSEALALSAVGLYCVAVWENGFPTAVEYFSHEKGVHDGLAASHYARNVIAQPLNTPIYFAVDYDASSAEVETDLKPYFIGVRESLKADGGLYHAGVYGNGVTCRGLSQAGLVSFTWLAQPSGWMGADFDAWSIKQLEGATLFGLSVDLDETRGHGGGFQVE